MTFSASSFFHIGLGLAIALVFIIGSPCRAQDGTAAPPATAPAASQPAKDLPKAEDVIKAALDAMGTKKVFEDLKSVAIKASMTTPMGDMSMDMKTLKPGSFLLMQVLPGMGESSMGSNGMVGWSHSAMGYQLLDKENLDQVRNQSNMYRMVFNVQEDFPTMETVDLVQFNHMDCYKVKMLAKDPEMPSQFGFFAVEGKLMQGMEVSQEGPMGAMTTTITFGEWKKIDPLTLFTKLSIDQAGIQMGPMNITEVEFNNLEPTAFEPPAEVLDLVKAKAAEAASQPAPASASAPATTIPASP